MSFRSSERNCREYSVTLTVVNALKIMTDMTVTVKLEQSK